MEVQQSFFDTKFEKHPFIEGDFFQLQNRRYIGNKYKLTGWIFSILNKECLFITQVESKKIR